MRLYAPLLAAFAASLSFAACDGGSSSTELFTSSSSSGAGGAGSTSSSGAGGGTSSGMTSSSSSSSGMTSSSSSGTVSPLCGNGNVDFNMGEECDDGNTQNGDGCSATCAIEAAPTCGNGALDLAQGEECDDGGNQNGDGCSASCQLEVVGQTCGNGTMEGLEVCDDNNTQNGDGCNPTCNLKGQTSLFAGSPGQGGTADGVGITARFSGAAVLAIDDTSVYVGEEASRRVRRVNIATGAVVTIAGSGGGYADNPVGTSAAFGSLEALGTDGITLWVADSVNSRIRAVSLTPPHAVTTVAGSGTQGYMDGNGAQAQFDGIRGLTYYNGFVYLVDPTAATVRRFNPATGDVVTLAGTPYMTGQTDGIGAAARFVSPRYIASDGSGMLYIADTNGNKIRTFNTVTNEVKTFAGDGTCGYVDGAGAGARIHRPRGLTSDGTSVYWAEFNAHTIRQGVVATQAVSTFLGSISANPCLVNCSCNPQPLGGYVEGVGSMAQLAGPFSVAFHFPSKSLFVYDSGNFVLRRAQ